MKMIDNVKSLTSEMTKLSKELATIKKALTDINSVSEKTIKKTKSAASQGGDIGLGSAAPSFTSSARFSTATINTGPVSGTTGGVGAAQSTGVTQGQSVVKAFSSQDTAANNLVNTTDNGKANWMVAGAKFAAIAMVGAYNAAPDLGATLARESAYYDVTRRAGAPTSRRSMAAATFSNMRLGMTSEGSDANVGQILTYQGMLAASTSQTSAYQKSIKQVEGLGRIMGNTMSNETAAGVVSNFASGGMAARQYQYGINTQDKKGNPLGLSNIAQQIFDRARAGQKVNQEDVRANLQAGMFDQYFQQSGMNAADQEVVKNLLLQAGGNGGKVPDIGNRSAVDKLMGTQAAAGNAAPYSAQQQLNASETSKMNTFAAPMIKGMEAATKIIVDKLNPALEKMAAALGYFKGATATTASNRTGGAAMGAAIAAAQTLADALGSLPLIGGAAGKGSGFGAGFGVAGTAALGGAADMAAPAAGKITTKFGAKSGSDIWKGRPHTGDDYAGKLGDPIYAAMDGIAFDDSPGADYGKYVEIDHGNGFQTLYAHMDSSNVSPGQKIRKGDLIGRIGKTGNTTGPHLHFEVRRGKNNPVNPASLKGSVSGTNYLTGNSTSSPGVRSMLGASSAADMEQGDWSDLRSAASRGSNRDALDASNLKILGTGDQKTFATSLITGLGGKVTAENTAAILTWMRYEGGHWKNKANYNPLNTTLNLDGSKNVNSVGVKAYQNWDQGLSATMQTLTGASADQRGYSKIVDDLRSGASGKQLLHDINNSAWVSGQTNNPRYKGMGGGTPGYGASMPSARSIYAASAPTSSAKSIHNHHNNVTINVQVAQATDQEAMRLAKKIKEYLNSETVIGRVGAS